MEPEDEDDYEDEEDVRVGGHIERFIRKVRVSFTLCFLAALKGSKRD